MSQLDILNPHPRGWTNPLNLRVSAALADAGVWDTTPLELVCSGAEWAMLNFTYTRRAANGAFDWQIQTSIYAATANIPTGAGEWATISLYASGLMAAGTDIGSRVQREFMTYQAVGAAAETFVYGPIHLGRTVERVRVTARESGAPTTPETALLQITAELY